MAEKEYNIDVKGEAINLVQTERNMFEEQVVFVTPRVAFRIKHLIEQLRKNYWGIFDEPHDANTGRKKIWIPLTESVVDTYVKNTDLDTKDINVRSKKGASIIMASVVRAMIRNYLDKQYMEANDNTFGEDLDETERSLAIDGSAVWKTYEVVEKGKKRLVRQDVDLLNLYIDYTGTESLQKKYRVTERALMDVEQIKGMKGWHNTELVKPVTGLNPRDWDLTRTYQSTTKAVDVYELWGLIPKYLVTGDRKDTEEIEGHIVVSGLEAQNPLCHLIEENKTGKRPYEEAHTKRVKGRWLGRGPAEAVMMLQVWMNTIVNIRINRSYVSQLGIFKIRNGSGVTPEMMAKLASNGAIRVNSLDDIEQFVMQEASQASYQDEQNIQQWAARVTATFEAVTGEQLPSSTPATNAVLQARAANESYTMLRDNIGAFLTRWITRQVLPYLEKTYTIGDIVRITGNIENVREFDKMLAREALARKLDEAKENGIIVTQEEARQAYQSALEKYSQMGDERFVELSDKIDTTDYDVEIYVTNEDFDKGVLLQNLTIALQAVEPALRQVILRQMFDLMGLDVHELDAAMIEAQASVQAQQMQQLPQGQPEVPTAQTDQQAVTQANIPGGVQV